MVNDLRPHTARTMKMEPAPWIRDYVVDMEELYTELTLEKINKKLLWEERVKLENYKELFSLYNSGKMMQFFNIIYYIPGMKILFKGDPGMGKTSLVKKIAWDWAKKSFVQVSIVFFVYLKLVKPGESIENAIVKQTYVLEDRGYTREKMTEIMQNLGQDCLLILDGLDECAHGQNDEVLKIVRGSKFVNCNIILTSRPHSTREIERYFGTIVSVEGFTRSEARRFSLRIVPNEKKVDIILNFNPAGERADRPVHNVPILLSFLCLLVREDNIDLSDQTISMGEIYFRMVQCLYKKFTIRKGIDFELSSLVDVLMSLGRLALETLFSGNSLLQRSKIIEQVGEDVFEYGLLIGQDGFSLTRDMTADILVTFPHQSLQEFLGAFYFVLSLGKKQTVNHVDRAVEEYLKNPLFSQFCLWFLNESNEFFSIPERAVAYEVLCCYVAEKIDEEKVNFVNIEEKYPLMSLALGNIRPEFALKAFEGALMKCYKIKHLAMEPHHPYERILKSIHAVTFQRLKSIVVSNFVERDELTPETSPLRFLCERLDCSFDLTVKCDLDKEPSDASKTMLNTVLKFCEGRNKFVHLSVRGEPPVSLQSNFSIRTLNLEYCKPVMNEMYPQLVNLFLSKCDLDSHDLSNLAETSTQGRLPNLSTLEIGDTYYISGLLSVLLRSTFPSLQTLILSKCDLQIADVQSLQQARRDTRLPKLRHLDVSFNHDLACKSNNVSSKSLLPLLFEKGMFTLVARGCSLNSNAVCTVGNKTFFSELTTLDMSRNQVFRGGLSALMSHSFPHLQILVLRGCGLTSDDLISLAQASNQGKLLDLKHLDISENNIGWASKGNFRLFQRLEVLPSLSYLILCACWLNLQDLCCLVQARLDGKLPRIRRLDISFNGLSDHVGILSRDPITLREISWGNVICYDDQRSKDLRKTRTQ